MEPDQWEWIEGVPLVQRTDTTFDGIVNTWTDPALVGCPECGGAVVANDRAKLAHIAFHQQIAQVKTQALKGLLG